MRTISGTDALGLAHLGAGLDAEGLGLVAGGDAAGGVGVGGDDGEGTVAVLGVKLLLDRRKERVEVDVEEGEAVGFGIRVRDHGARASIASHYIRFLFAVDLWTKILLMRSDD